MKTVIKMISSGLYVGYIPLASGTIASIWGLLIYLQLYQLPLAYLFVTIMLFLLGFLISGRAEEVFGKKDSKRIVIDEIAAICLVYLFIKPEPFMLVAGFILFRIFDIIKPPPAKSMQILSGGAAVMMDDIIAALYTISGLFILYRLKTMGILR